jgi:hypothetical protein
VLRLVAKGRLYARSGSHKGWAGGGLAPDGDGALRAVLNAELEAGGTVEKVDAELSVEVYINEEAGRTAWETSFVEAAEAGEWAKLSRARSREVLRT